MNPHRKVDEMKKKLPNKTDKTLYYKEITNLHGLVSRKFDECESKIFDAQDAVGYSNLARTTKTKLLKMFQNVWADMNEIVDTIGRVGKVK